MCVNSLLVTSAVQVKYGFYAITGESVPSTTIVTQDRSKGKLKLWKLPEEFFENIFGLVNTGGS